MSGSLTRGGGENVPGNPDACATHTFTYLVRGSWRFHIGPSQLQQNFKHGSIQPFFHVPSDGNLFLQRMCVSPDLNALIGKST